MRKLLSLFALWFVATGCFGQGVQMDRIRPKGVAVSSDSSAVPVAGQISTPDLITSSTPVVDVRAHGSVSGATLAAPCVAGGCTILLPSGYRETFTSTISLGTSTKPVTLWMMPDTMLTCNVTDGTDCLIVHQGSGFVGWNTGAQPADSGGAAIKLASTANVRTLVTPGETSAPGQAYMQFSKIYFDGGGTSPTVSLALINLDGVNGLTAFENSYIARFNCIGLRVASNANAVTGPFVLNNIWVDGGYNANARPLLITAQTSSLSGGVKIVGGIYHHPGAGKASIELNGSAGGAAGYVRDIYINSYIENISGAGGSIGVKIVDAYNVVVDCNEFLMLNNDTGVDISQTGAGRTSLIDIRGMRWVGFNAAGGTLVNNHISGEVISGAGFVNTQLPNYWYGGDGTPNVIPQTSTGFGFVVKRPDGNILFNAPLNNGSFYFANWTDAQLSHDISSGITASQVAAYRFLDRNTAEWQIDKSAGNSLEAFDLVNGKRRFLINQSSSVGGAPFTTQRFSMAQATVLSSGNLTLSAGWGTTASVSSVSGTDSNFTATIASAGTGQAAQPTITLTFVDGAWPTFPICVANRGDVVSPLGAMSSSATTTVLTLTFQGTPVAASSYVVNVSCFGH